VNVRPPTHEYDAVHVALLAELEREPDLEAVLDRLAERWGERVGLRLLGASCALRLRPHHQVGSLTARLSEPTAGKGSGGVPVLYGLHWPSAPEIGL